MEMIIQNETGNFTLHVRISDSKEYDFLKDVTELARKYDFENDDFEIEDPEKETDQVPETTISEAAEEYKGFLHIRCEECGETISYNAKEPETQHKCKKCGHVTQLRALKPMYAECKAWILYASVGVGTAYWYIVSGVSPNGTRGEWQAAA